MQSRVFAFGSNKVNEPAVPLITTIWPIPGTLSNYAMCVLLFTILNCIVNVHLQALMKGCLLKFTFSGFNPSSLVTATERAAKASLISNTSTSSSDQPAFAT